MSSKPLRVAFETHGCRSNYADTVDLQAALAEMGDIPCELDSDADVFVINTCTVTDQADKSAFKSIKRIRKHNPDARIVVTGCLAEVGKDELNQLEAADIVVGPGRRKQLIAAIREGLIDEQIDPAKVSYEQLLEGRDKRPKKNGASFRSISLDHDLSPVLKGPGTTIGEVGVRARYHLRVQEGCENSCTFCIIPASRGRLSSRSMRDVLDDIKQLSERGYKEIVLTGTHLGGYGEDIGLSLNQLLENIAEMQPSARIRLSSIDPNDISENTIDILSKSNVFCKHLHICVQAFCDSVLKRMNRRYELQEVYDIIEQIEQKWSDCCLGSDVIAGFPGETREQVDKQIEVFESLPFSYLHIFPYSERSGTAAVKLDGAIDVGERRRRAARWRSVASRRKCEFLESLIGRELEVVVEQIEGDVLKGTSREFASVSAKFSGTSPVIGSIIKLKGHSVNKGDELLRCDLLNQAH